MAIHISAGGGHRAVKPQHANRPVGRPKTKTSALLPAASTAGTRTRSPELTDHEQSLSGDAIETFTRIVGGRRALVDVLSVASDAPEVERVVSTLLDPRYHGWSLRQVCALVGITVADVFTAYRKALIVRSHLRATHIVADKLPPIVDDVMTRATPRIKRCPDCKGTRGSEVCVTCEDTGQVTTEPDLDRQKLALELGQLTSKGGQSIYVQQNAQVVAAAATLTSQGSGVLEQLHQAVGSLLFTPDRHRDVIEAEVAASAASRPDPPQPSQPPE